MLADIYVCHLQAVFLNIQIGLIMLEVTLLYLRRLLDYWLSSSNLRVVFTCPYKWVQCICCVTSVISLSVQSAKQVHHGAHPCFYSQIQNVQCTASVLSVRLYSVLFAARISFAGIRLFMVECKRTLPLAIFYIFLAVPLYAMEALGGRGGIAPTHSRPRH
jgi:hypothetical protein